MAHMQEKRELILARLAEGFESKRPGKNPVRPLGSSLRRRLIRAGVVAGLVIGTTGLILVLNPQAPQIQFPEGSYGFVVPSDDAVSSCEAGVVKFDTRGLPYNAGSRGRLGLPCTDTVPAETRAETLNRLAGYPDVKVEVVYPGLYQNMIDSLPSTP